jgi:putative membrane protein
MRIALPALLLVTFVGSEAVGAHGLGHELTAPGALSPWDVLAVTVLALAGGLYIRGIRRMAERGATHPRRETAAFSCGWLALMATLLPPLDALALERFSAHMAQHELMMLAAVPMLMAGRPLSACLWGLPASLRPGFAALVQRGPVGEAWRVLTAPLAAWALHGVAIWIWHAPALYEWAVRNEAVHAFQHLTFVGTSALFWWGLLYGRYGRAGYGAAVFYVFTTAVHTGLLGALVTFARSPLYPIYVSRAAVHRLDALGDQQVAGLLMWVPAGILLTATGLALFAAWMGEAERRSNVTRTSCQ